MNNMKWGRALLWAQLLFLASCVGAPGDGDGTNSAGDSYTVTGANGETVTCTLTSNAPFEFPDVCYEQVSAGPRHTSPVVHLWVQEGNYSGCGGFFVSPTQIITAGHCARGHSARNIQVYDAGRIPSYRHVGKLAVNGVTVHPNFDGDLYDVAVLTLAKASPGPTLSIGDADLADPTAASVYHFTRNGDGDATAMSIHDCNLRGTDSTVPVSICDNRASVSGDSGLPIVFDGRAYLSVIGHRTGVTRGQTLSHVRALLGL